MAGCGVKIQRLIFFELGSDGRENAMPKGIAHKQGTLSPSLHLNWLNKFRRRVMVFDSLCDWSAVNDAKFICSLVQGNFRRIRQCVLAGNDSSAVNSDLSRPHCIIHETRESKGTQQQAAPMELQQRQFQTSNKLYKSWSIRFSQAPEPRGGKVRSRAKSTCESAVVVKAAIVCDIRDWPISFDE